MCPLPREVDDQILMHSTNRAKNFQFDFSRGIARFEKGGRTIDPCIVHFIVGRGPEDEYRKIVSYLQS